MRAGKKLNRGQTKLMGVCARQSDPIVCQGDHSWSLTSIESLAESISEKAPIGFCPYLEIGDVFPFQWKFQGKEKPAVAGARLAKPGDIVISNVRPGRGVMVRLDRESAVSAGFTVLRNRHFADWDFVFSCLQQKSFFDFLVQKCEGGVYPTCCSDDVLQYQIPIPPMEIQKKIAAFTFSIHSSLDASRNISAQILLLKRAIWVWFKKLGRVRGWPTKVIGQIAKVANGSTPSKKEPSYWENGNIPWLPTGKVNDRVITNADAFITEKALKACPLSLLPIGTSLIAMIGQGKTRGMTAFLQLEACINQNFAAVIPGKGINPKYLFHFLESQYESLRGSARGSNQDALNCSIVKDFPVLIPPASNQSAIVGIFDSLDLRVSTENRFIFQCENLKQSLLSNLLSGPFPLVSEVEL